MAKISVERGESEVTTPCKSEVSIMDLCVALGIPLGVPGSVSLVTEKGQTLLIATDVLLFQWEETKARKPRAKKVAA